MTDRLRPVPLAPPGRPSSVRPGVVRAAAQCSEPRLETRRIAVEVASALSRAAEEKILVAGLKARRCCAWMAPANSRIWSRVKERSTPPLMSTVPWSASLRGIRALCDNGRKVRPCIPGTAHHASPPPRAAGVLRSVTWSAACAVRVCSP